MWTNRVVYVIPQGSIHFLNWKPIYDIMNVNWDPFLKLTPKFDSTRTMLSCGRECFIRKLATGTFRRDLSASI